MRKRIFVVGGVAIIGAMALSTTPASAQDVLQSVGLVPGMTCETFNDPALNWADVPGYGWGQSWAQWVDDQRGGPVCVRTLHHDGEMWVIR